MFHAFGDVVGGVLTLPCIMSLMVSVTLGLGSGDMSRVAMVVVVVVGMVGQVVEMVELGRRGPGGEPPLVVGKREGVLNLRGEVKQLNLELGGRYLCELSESVSVDSARSREAMEEK